MRFRLFRSKKEKQTIAVALMAELADYVIVDVRSRTEYDNGHIPGAICVPVDHIRRRPPEQLPDRAQQIFVYCWSGMRSRKAAKRLARLGYTNVYEMGGLSSWEGELVRTADEKDAAR